VFHNVGHVTAAGTVATWWLVPQAPNPTLGALKRACTTSFGSICFGSLIVAILQAMRAMLRQARRQAHGSANLAAQCCLCFAECFLSAIERAIAFMNKYAYTQIAIYGKDFISASRDTWKLFVERNFDLLINDDLSGMVLGLGSFLGGLAACAVGTLVAWAISSSDGSYMVLGVISFLMGMLMTSLVMSVISSAVATTYVLWAQCPGELSQTRPQEFQAIREAAKMRFPDRDF